STTRGNTAMGNQSCLIGLYVLSCQAFNPTSEQRSEQLFSHIYDGHTLESFSELVAWCLRGVRLPHGSSPFAGKQSSAHPLFSKGSKLNLAATTLRVNTSLHYII